MERMRGRGGMYGGDVFLILGQQINNKNNHKNKIQQGLRWPPFDILHKTTNQKQAGMTEEGWDRPRDHARTLREHDGNNKPLAESNDDDNDNDKYDKDGDIPNNSAPPAESIGRSCPES